MVKAKKQVSPMTMALDEFFELNGGYGEWCPAKMLEIANKHDVCIVELESLWFERMEQAGRD